MIYVYKEVTEISMVLIPGRDGLEQPTNMVTTGYLFGIPMVRKTRTSNPKNAERIIPPKG